jgi:hypothetical protein
MDSGREADAVLTIERGHTFNRVVVEATEVFRQDADKRGSFTRRLEAAADDLRRDVTRIAQEAGAQIWLYLFISPQAHPSVYADGIRQFRKEVIPVIRRALAEAQHDLREIEIDPSELSPAVHPILRRGLARVGRRVDVTIQYGAPMPDGSLSFSDIAGVYMGVDYEGINAAIQKKRARFAQYRRLANDLGAVQVWLLLYADGSSPSRMVTSIPLYGFDRARVNALRAPQFDAIYLAAWGNWTPPDAIDLVMPLEHPQYSWKIFELYP